MPLLVYAEFGLAFEHYAVTLYANVHEVLNGLRAQMLLAVAATSMAFVFSAMGEAARAGAAARAKNIQCVKLRRSMASLITPER